MVNKNVFKFLLKDGKEVNVVMLVGRLFHARATVTRNDRSTMVLSRVRRTIRCGQEPDRSRCRDDDDGDGYSRLAVIRYSFIQQRTDLGGVMSKSLQRHQTISNEKREFEAQADNGLSCAVEAVGIASGKK